MVYTLTCPIIPDDVQLGGINTYGYVNQNPLKGIDPYGLWTFQVGGSFNGTFFGFNGNLGGGFTIDGDGNLGAYTYVGGGAGMGAGLGGSLNFAFSNADTICNLKGPFANQGGDLGVGAQVSADAFEGVQDNGKDVFGMGFGVGFGAGASAYAGGSNTRITPITRF